MGTAASPPPGTPGVLPTPPAPTVRTGGPATTVHATRPRRGRGSSRPEGATRASLPRFLAAVRVYSPVGPAGPPGTPAPSPALLATTSRSPATVPAIGLAARSYAGRAAPTATAPAALAPRTLGTEGFPHGARASTRRVDAPAAGPRLAPTSLIAPRSGAAAPTAPTSALGGGAAGAGACVGRFLARIVRRTRPPYPSQLAPSPSTVTKKGRGTTASTSAPRGRQEAARTRRANAGRPTSTRGAATTSTPSP